MLLTRLKLMTAVLLVTGLAGASGVVYQLQAQTSGKPDIKTANKQPLEKQIEDLRREIEQLKRQRWPLTIPPRLPVEPAEVEQLKQLHQQIQGVEKVEEGLKLLKEGTAGNRANKGAVEEFEKAFKKLRDRLSIKPGASMPEEVAKQLDKLIEKLNSRVETPTVPGTPGAGPREGVVQQVSPEGLVRVSIGSDAGLQTGKTLEVYRLNPPTYLGRLLIVNVASHASVGKVVRSVPDKPIKLNDRVTPSLQRR